MLLYKDLKAIYNAYIEKELYILPWSRYNKQKRTNVREKRREVWNVPSYTVTQIVLCDLKVTTFIVLP